MRLRANRFRREQGWRIERTQESIHLLSVTLWGLVKVAPKAVGEGSHELVLWAESPEEARMFMAHSRSTGLAVDFDRIFVAKRSSRSRVSDYVGGQYYVTTDDEHVDVYHEVVDAPAELVNLVQWCTCDAMISEGPRPLAVFEDTTHIVRMNLYQRIPRLARAASHGVPALMLQGTRGLDLSMRGDRWALHRYLQAFHGMATVYPFAPPAVFWYEPSDEAFAGARAAAFAYLSALISGDQETIGRTQRERCHLYQSVARAGFQGDQAPHIPSIQVGADEVIVRIGAKPDKKSWREKGSGQMDPYLGMIAAAKYIYCYDGAGAQQRPLVVEFTYLPRDFFFFRDYEKSNSLYKKLAFEIADEVRFLG